MDKNLVCPVGYTLVTKDRLKRAGGGVAIVCRNDWKVKAIEVLAENGFECLWVEICPTANQVFYAGVIYHPPDPVYQSDDLLDYLTDAFEFLLTNNPDCRIILAGDTNQLNFNTWLNQFSLSQLVKHPTRGNNILDIFLTNVPFDFGSVKCANSLINTGHKCVIVNPRNKTQARRKWIEIRDTRPHCKLEMIGFLKEIDWRSELADKNIDCAVSHFYSIICPLIDIFFPLMKVKMSSNDPVFISPLVKH